MRSDTITYIPIEQLDSHPWGPEVGLPLSGQDHEMLKLSIVATGIQIPLVVWKRDGRLVAIAGMNRLNIAGELKIKEVPAIVRDFPDEQTAKLFALTDNLRGGISTPANGPG